jgi:hypothetical protein
MVRERDFTSFWVFLCRDFFLLGFVVGYRGCGNLVVHLKVLGVLVETVGVMSRRSNLFLSSALSGGWGVPLSFGFEALGSEEDIGFVYLHRGDS